MDDLLKLLSIEAAELSVKFTKASLEGRGTPQEISDRREGVFKTLIAKYFPFPFRVTKGNISDSSGKRSASIDCLVLNPDHPYTVSDEGNFSVILADGVDFAIELKPALMSKVEIERALVQIRSVKKLRRARFGGLNSDPLTKTIPSIIFSNESYVDPLLLLESIVDFYQREGIKRDEQFDIIAVNNRFIVLNCRSGSYMAPRSGILPAGLYVIALGENTLACLLMYMNTLPLSSPRLSNSVLSAYLKPESFNGLATNEILNSRLNAIEGFQ